MFHRSVSNYLEALALLQIDQSIYKSLLSVPQKPCSCDFGVFHVHREPHPLLGLAWQYDVSHIQWLCKYVSSKFGSHHWRSRWLDFDLCNEDCFEEMIESERGDERKQEKIWSGRETSFSKDPALAQLLLFLVVSLIPNPSHGLALLGAHACVVAPLLTYGIKDRGVCGVGQNCNYVQLGHHDSGEQNLGSLLDGFDEWACTAPTDRMVGRNHGQFLQSEEWDPHLARKAMTTVKFERDRAGRSFVIESQLFTKTTGFFGSEERIWGLSPQLARRQNLRLPRNW